MNELIESLSDYLEIRAEVKEKEATVEYDRSYFLADDYGRLDRAEKKFLDLFDARVTALVVEQKTNPGS